MIEHGDGTADEKALFLDQLERATVVWHCPCGCASVDFAIDGKEAPLGVGLRIVGDYVAGDEATMCGVFVFECAGLLAGIEIHPWSERGDCSRLPSPAELRPYG